jgi:hypothetical protein
LDEGFKMTWNAKLACERFVTVAQLAGVQLVVGDLRIEELPAPHVPPRRLPAGTMAIYVFNYRAEVLKVGKVGPKSQARYTSQHYNPGSANSTLAASIIADAEHLGLTLAETDKVGDWIRGNVDRVNIVLPSHLSVLVLTLLESFLICSLRPRYEGYKSQSLI